MRSSTPRGHYAKEPAQLVSITARLVAGGRPRRSDAKEMDMTVVVGFGEVGNLRSMPNEASTAMKRRPIANPLLFNGHTADLDASRVALNSSTTRRIRAVSLPRFRATPMALPDTPYAPLPAMKRYPILPASVVVGRGERYVGLAVEGA